VKWPIVINWRQSKWAGLAFADKLKLVALRFQAGAGMAMTVFAAYALFKLANLGAIWPVFYLGGIALIIVAIVVTGFGALLYKRVAEFEAFGVKFKTQDQEGAAALAQQAKEVINAQPVQQPNLEDIRGVVDSALAGHSVVSGQPPMGGGGPGQNDQQPKG